MAEPIRPHEGIHDTTFDNPAYFEEVDKIAEDAPFGAFATDRQIQAYEEEEPIQVSRAQIGAFNTNLPILDITSHSNLERS